MYIQDCAPTINKDKQSVEELSFLYTYIFDSWSSSGTNIVVYTAFINYVLINSPMLSKILKKDVTHFS